MPEPNSSFWKRSVGRFGKSKGDLSSGGSASGEASSSAATTFRFVEDGGAFYLFLPLLLPLLFVYLLTLSILSCFVSITL